MVSVAAEEVELTGDELLALVELMHQVVEVDHDTSPEESDEIALIAKQVGEDRFWETVRQTLGKTFTVDDSAKRVTRRPAQELIYSLLEELAESDGTEHDEQLLLDSLRHAWSVED
jgi:hypothetical protein